MGAGSHAPEPETGRKYSGRGMKTHCKKGHAYTPENTYLNPADGGKKCRTCRSLRERKARIDSKLEAIADWNRSYRRTL